jgi:AraC-like DNA-binding protein
MALNFAAGGRIRYGLEGEPLNMLSAPVAWWTFPGPRFAYGACAGETWDHYYVSFSGARAERMLARGLIGSERPLFCRVHDPARFRQGFEALLGWLRERPAENPRAVCQLEDLLLQVQEQDESVTVHSYIEERILSLLPSLREQPGTERNWSREAAGIGISEVHFRRVFRALTGLPPGQFQKRAALDLAARLLQTTHEPVKGIAESCGYHDIHHFTRVFGQRFGIPPAAYRREMRP